MTNYEENESLFTFLSYFGRVILVKDACTK